MQIGYAADKAERRLLRYLKISLHEVDFVWIF